MRLLILTNGNKDTCDTTTVRMIETMIQRGHSVDVLGTNDLTIRSEGKAPWYVRMRQQRSAVITRSMAQALKKHLQAREEYDVIVPTHIYCGRILDALHRDPEAILPPMILVSVEYDNLPRKAQLSCDDYFVMSANAQKTMQRWGIPDSKIHLIDVTKHTASEICSRIEKIQSEWAALLNAFINGA